MIRLNCDNCERPLDVPEDLAGKKIKCPHCGDVNLVPVAVAASPPAATASDAAAAGAAGGSEERVLMVRQAMFRARPLTFLGLLLVAIGGISGLVYFGVVQWQAIWFWVSAGAAVAALIVLGFWKISTLDHSIEVTTRRTIETKGIFSRSTSEVRHQDVRNIQVTQSFFQRLFNVGTLGISSAGQDDLEIFVNDLPQPRKVRDAIDRYRGKGS
jgi:membrane protein YdbS with pleckstrin-like domain